MDINPELDLVISRLIEVPREKIWAAWNDPEILAQWWCPKPWRTEVHGFDFRSGGTFNVTMHGPNGEQSPNPGLFLDVVPMSRIVFTSTLTEGWRPVPSPFIPITAVFSLSDEQGGTRYSATVLHPDADTKKQHEEMGFFEGWGVCFDQLEAIAKSLT